jgi:polygalacturonase
MCLVFCLPAAGDVFDVRNYGAAGDKTTMDTRAFQAAIDDCAKAGGGIVRVPQGDYLSGTIRLRSHVTLQLDEGATLWQSRRPDDYPDSRNLVVAERAEHIALVGSGVIHGIGEGDLGRRADKSDAQMPEFRAGIVRFEECKDVTIRNVHFQFSDTWTLTFRFCENVVVEDVTIRNHYFHTNSDGIDPVSCKGVRIARCDIVAGDDCIVCKTADGRPCEDVRVSDCRLGSIATAVKLGTESSGDFRDIEFTNCTISNSTVGIGLFLKDGGTMERIKFAKIQLENYTPRGEANVEHTMFPLFVDIEQRHEDSKVGRIRDLTLEDLVITSGFGALVQGMPESPIENLTVKNVVFNVHEPQDCSQRRKHIGGRRTLRNQRDTEYARLPGWFVVAHVDGLTVDGLRVNISAEDRAKFPGPALTMREVVRPDVRNVSPEP